MASAPSQQGPPHPSMQPCPVCIPIADRPVYLVAESMRSHLLNHQSFKEWRCTFCSGSVGFFTKHELLYHYRWEHLMSDEFEVGACQPIRVFVNQLFQLGSDAESHSSARVDEQVGRLHDGSRRPDGAQEQRR
jgi:hypothetical protein